MLILRHPGKIVKCGKCGKYSPIFMHIANCNNPPNIPISPPSSFPIIRPLKESKQEIMPTRMVTQTLHAPPCFIRCVRGRTLYANQFTASMLGHKSS